MVGTAVDEDILNAVHSEVLECVFDQGNIGQRKQALLPEALATSRGPRTGQVGQVNALLASRG